jgi:hypothetical protein
MTLMLSHVTHGYTEHSCLVMSHMVTSVTQNTKYTRVDTSASLCFASVILKVIELPLLN